MGNYLRMTKEELVKKIYYDLKNSAAHAAKPNLHQKAKKHDSNISIENVHERINEASRGTLNRRAMAD